MSEQYSFAFTISDFDRPGEEHRLVTETVTINPGDGLPRAVKSLVEFVARMLRCPPDQLAARRIMIKSAWVRCCSPVKRRRITPKELLESLLKIGLAPKGRSEGRLERTPRKPMKYNK